MTNLTLTIDAELLKRARIRALEEGTSVNAVVRELFVGPEDLAYGTVLDGVRILNPFLAEDHAER